MKATGKLACLALVLAAVLRCESDTGSPLEVPSPPDCTAPGCNVSSVTVSPATATVYEGLSLQFRATARDASGRIITGVSFRWEVSDSAVAEIDANGRLTGKAAGIVQVRAIANGKVGSMDLVVIDATVVSLEIVAPPSLLVNESALLKVTARNADGAEVPIPPLPQLQWASSDEAIARVDFGRAPVVTALRRGTVAINVSAGGVEASVSLSVLARVVIGRPPFGHSTSVEMASGEDLQFAALFVDVNGATIDEIPSVTWASDTPDVAAVSSTGRVSGLRTGRSTITARNSEGVGTMEVLVTDVIAGLPARIRLAHVANGHGPLRFVPSRGTPITLAFGESVEVPIVSGTFRVLVEGLSLDINTEGSWLVRGGDHLEVFGTSLGVTGWWINVASVPADSGLVRFVQGTGPPVFAMVVLLGAPGATVMGGGELIHCYFDPLEITEYIRVPAGEIDVIMGGKGLFFNPSDATVSARGPITVTPGRAVTYVLAGESPQTMRMLAFPDF